MKNYIDRGKPFVQQASIQKEFNQAISGNIAAVRDFIIFVESMFDGFNNQRYDGWNHYYIQFEGVLPVLCAGVFNPEHDINGRAIISFSEEEIGDDYLGMSILIHERKTHCLFSWPKNTRERASARYVTSLSEISDTQVAEAIVRIAFEYLENVFISPSWWENLSAERKNIISELVNSGTPTVDYSRLIMRKHFDETPKILDTLLKPIVKHII